MHRPTLQVYSLFFILLTSAVSSANVVNGRGQLQRDVEGYAVAVCLTRQDSAFLKQQGDGWGAIIINRGHGEIGDWQPLIAAVKAEVAQRPMAVVHGDIPKDATAMPVFYCAEIIDAPRVRAAIARTMGRMASAYRK